MAMMIKHITTQLKTVLDDALNLNGHTKQWSDQICLLGNIPELDSMSVVNVILALEKKFDLFIEDDDINTDTFATIESLAIFIIQKKEGAIYRHPPLITRAT
jgi:acyl carrier protein